MRKARTVFVGRQHETEELLAGLEEVVGGHGRLFVIDGEPGIGKTRLAEELAVHAPEHGALVLWSRCWKASQAPAYWPWVQLVRACLRAAQGSEIISLAEPAISDIAQILPEACESLCEPGLRPNPAPSDPEQARFRLFDAICTIFRIASNARPLVLVLDDLGAADRASLLLLSFFVRELHHCRILVVVTYRDAEVRGSLALAEAIGDLAREGTHIRLRGLDDRQVGELIEAETGERPDAQALAAVCCATGGNPFFVQSIAKLVPVQDLACIARKWPETRRMRLANGLAAAVGAHLAPLSERAKKLLVVAAVAGREFQAEVLETATGLEREALYAALSQAEDYGLISEFPDSPGRYRFVHSLVADTLYEGLTSVERARLHIRIGEALEAIAGQGSNAPLAELARHFFEGARAGGYERALHYAEIAAGRATAMSAFEEAARFYQMALASIKMTAKVDEHRRCELMLMMGEAQNRCADYMGARDTFVQAAELAARLGSLEMLAHAALGYPGLQWDVSPDGNQQAIELLERALRAFPERDDPWRAMLMARLASELYHRPSAAGRREKLSRRAVEMARKIGDQRALLAILGHRDLTLSGPDTLQARLANAHEMMQVAEKIGSEIGRYMAFLSRAICYRHLGDVRKAEAEAEAMGMVARMTRLPVCNWGTQCFAACRGLMEGRYSEAEESARECLKFAQRMRGCEADDLFWPAMIDTMREQGRLAELEPMAARTVERCPAQPAFRALHALVNCGLGRKQLARADFELLAAHDFTDLPRDNTFLACAVALAQVCAALEDRTRAEQLIRLLSPYADLNAVFGPLASFGSMARYLGILAVTACRFDEAENWFRKALAFNGRMNARPYLASTLVDYAEMLIRKGSQRDFAKATEFLASAQEISEAVGMRALAYRIDEIARRTASASANAAVSEVPERKVVNGAAAGAEQAPRAPRARVLELVAGRGPRRAGISEAGSLSSGTSRAAVSDDAANHAIFRRDGDYWTISYEGKVFRLKHLKGLDCLAYLLSHPATEVHSSGLAAVMNKLPSGDGPAVLDSQGDGGSAADLGDAGPILDDKAKNSYRHRLMELREELEQAKRIGDLGRAERAEREIDFVTEELSRAVGLGGRDRRAASSVERARLSVTKAIKSVVAKISQYDRELGDHLSTTVRTGTFCSYKPDPRYPIVWKLD